VSAYYCATAVYTTQHRTVTIIFPLILQTIIIAQMTSTGGEGKENVERFYRHLQYNADHEEKMLIIC